MNSKTIKFWAKKYPLKAGMLYKFSPSSSYSYSTPSSSPLLVVADQVSVEAKFGGD